MDYVESVYYNDFQALGTQRISGMGLAPIPVISIIQYAQLEGVENIPVFKEVILNIDREYMSLISDRQKAESNKAKAKK